ncbi:MAG: HAD-IIIA family hydrolase [Gammaproteobacteria bacterium]|nr:HAD-IIIA family hydrolase [Gammaproteobacteria bacterium]
MLKPKQAVILCGGMGTRLMPYTTEIPKPMILCNGKPFLWYLLSQLAEQGVERFILLTGYLGEKIKNHFGDGRQWGWNIEYSQGPVDWDTGKRIWEAKDKFDDRFLLLYSDNYVPFSLEKILKVHEKNKCSLTFMVSLKSPGNIALGDNGIVLKYDNIRGDDALNYVEIGYMIVEKEETFKYFETPECSFSSILRKMADSKQISAWVQKDAYHSISDPERWRKTEEYLSFKKIILIDRDGVINVKAPQGEYICKWEEFEWIEDTVQSMLHLAKHGFTFIIISNQAGIARGMVCEKKIEEMHELMISKLADNGIEILDIYVCPHHWNDDCECRKPKAGLFYKIAKDYLLQMDRTLYIGDDVRDCEAAYNAGCGAVLIASNEEYVSIKNKPIWSVNVRNVSDAIQDIEKFMSGHLV